MADPTNKEIILEDTRFGMGDLGGVAPKYPTLFLNRRLDNSLSAFNTQNVFTYTFPLLPQMYWDLICILSQILLCKWEAARNAKKYKIDLDKLSIEPQTRVNQYINSAEALVIEYNRIADMVGVASIEEEGDDTLPLIDSFQGMLVMFDEDLIQTTDENVSTFIVEDTAFPTANGTTILTFTFTPNDCMDNNIGYGQVVTITNDAEEGIGSWVDDEVVDVTDGTYTRQWTVSDTKQRVTFTATIGTVTKSVIVLIGY